jgi:hypothetical protein
MDHDLFRTAADIFSACIFLNAAAGKLRAPATFEDQLNNYRLLPDRAAPQVARVIPVVELLTGGALLLAPFASRPLALVAPGVAAALLAVFAVAMAINLGRGRTEIDCGCGRSEGRQTLSWGLVGRNLTIAAGLMTLAAFAEPSAGWAEGLEAAAAGLVAFVLYLAHDRLGALPRTGAAAARSIPSSSTGSASAGGGVA